MITLKHSTTGVIKTAPTGYSWTSLFFGLLVPLFRGDVIWCLVVLIASSITFGIFWIFVFPFIYNKIYIKKLLEKGYIPATDYDAGYLRRKGWVA